MSTEHFTPDLAAALAGADSVELQAVQALLLDRYADANEQALEPTSDIHSGDAMTRCLESESRKAYCRGVYDSLQDIREAMAKGGIAGDG